MLLSIIMPTYNSIRDLPKIRKNLQPFLNQPNIEILLVDDGSVDKTVIALHESFDHAKNVKIQQLSAVKGPSFCRTVALNQAVGKYIYFMDSDDKLLTGFSKKVMPALKKYDADMFLFDYITFMHRITLWPKSRWVKRESVLKSVLRIRNWHASAGFLWNKVFKRQAIAGLKFKDTLFEDLDWCVQAVLKAKRFRYVSACGYHYLYHPNSLFNASARKKAAKLIHDRLAVQNRMIKAIGNHYLQSTKQAIISQMLAKYNLLVIFRMLVFSWVSNSYSKIKFQLFACYRQVDLHPRHLWEMILDRTIHRLMAHSEIT